MSSQLPEPNRFVNRFLEWFCSDRLIEEVQGDLHEAFYHRREEFGSFWANGWFLLDVIRFFRPGYLRPVETQNNQIAMHRNYFKAALRNFKKNGGYSSINLLGLILGCTCCLLIALHVSEEFSYDNFHADSKNTYRVVMDIYNNNELTTKSAPIYPGVGPVITDEYPEVMDFVRILPFGSGVYSVRKPDGTLIRYNEDKAVFADPNFFQMFGFKLIDGNPQEVLRSPNQTVLSASAAKRYFGDENPIGKTINYRGTEENVVTGVMEDFPETSHMQFDIISSLNSWNGYESWPQNFGWYDFYTFIRVVEGTDPVVLNEKVGGFLDVKKAENYARETSREQLWIQNVADIHLFSKGLSWEMGQNGGANQVYFLSAIAVLMLIVAWVNFINLSTARAVRRAKEVGVRKVVGAMKKHLIQQFLAEAFLYNFLALMISIGLVLLLVPGINGLLDISLDRSLLLSFDIVMGVTGVLLLGTLFSGFYPAIVLSSFKPLNVLKGSFYKRKSRFGFRQLLVTFQFVVSVVLIFGTIVVFKQVQYMQSQDLGLNVAQTLVLNGPTSSNGDGDLNNRRNIFKDRISEIPSVQNFTISNIVPGEENFSISSFYTRQDPDVHRDCYRVRVDENYFPNFSIDVISGRNFIKDMASDSNAIVLNKTAANMFGFSEESAIGEVLNFNSRYPLKVIGVVNDYHHSSLKESLDPMMFMYRPNAANYFSMKVEAANIPSTIANVEALWNDVYPDNPFQYFFLDEFFNRQYKSDQQFNTVFSAFAVMVIIVACMGLFGLVSFTVEQSRKEIGIRKVLGASVQKLIILLTWDYAVLIVISICISLPLGYFLMNEWLGDFAYRTSIGPFVYVLGALSIILITLVTVSFKSMAAANSNPVHSLRDE